MTSGSPRPARALALTMWLGLAACVALALLVPPRRAFAQAAVQEHSFLWKAANAKGSMYLVGSVHLLSRDFYPLNPALETAFKIDPYDTVVFNLLQMLDTLDKYTTVEASPFIFKFPADQAAVLKTYAVPLAQAAYDEYKARYAFTPAGPILIEIFDTHDSFAVRTAGLPGIVGALGACFGRVIAMDSPKARPPGDFSWQATLWHEIAHVFTLQASSYKVPRWLTEGVSVWSERQGRADWGRETHVPFARALDQGKILKLKDLNSGFQDPQMIVLAYYQASLVVDHLVATYGQPKLRDFVQAFSRGLDLDGALAQWRRLRDDGAEVAAQVRAAGDEGPGGLTAGVGVDVLDGDHRAGRVAMAWRMMPRTLSRSAPVMARRGGRVVSLQRPVSWAASLMYWTSLTWVSRWRSGVYQR